jgi:tetratricopeptide (TPR) repeat protein
MFKKNKMKKIAVLLGMSLLISVSIQAQKNKRTSAYMYNKNGEYKKAKEAIDAAVLHEKTMHDAKTWLYRGEIYYNIQENSLAELLAPDAVDVSYQSLLKAKEYDEKGSYTDEINIYLSNLAIAYFNRALAEFQGEDYDAAIKDFETNYEIGETMGKSDTITAFNIGMAGVYGNKPEVAAKYLSMCLDMDYNDARVFKYYSKSVKQLGDTTKAIQIIEDGMKLFPDDLTLLLELAQTYLETGENKKLREALLIAIESDSENSNLYLIVGQTFDNDSIYDKALEYYQKSIDLGGENPNVYYNIGAIYSNKGKAYLDEAKNLPLDEVKKYEELVEKGNVQLTKAMPYFEKALELNPDDEYSILALKNIYIQLKMNDKLKKLNERN